MRALSIAGAAAAVLALGGCQSFDLMAYANAANELDPGCFKDVDVKVTPMFLGAWVVPVVSGSYRKTCNPEQAAPTVRAPLVPGQVVGSLPAL